MWNNGKCMSYTTINKIKKRCCYEVSKSDNMGDFCRYHKRYNRYHEPLLNRKRIQDIKIFDINKKAIIAEKIKYMTKKTSEIMLNNFNAHIKTKIAQRNEILDQNHIHNLMMLNESWQEVNIMYQIKLNDQWWNLKTVLFHISQQLNHSNMENPFPTFPSDPFNRIPFTIKSLLDIKKRISLIGLSVQNINVALLCFLDLPLRKLNSYYNIAVDAPEEPLYDLIYDFSKKLRFRLMNNKNSQDCFNGYWVHKKTHPTDFEIVYSMWKEAPYQLYIPSRHNVITNPQKEYLGILLDSFPEESWYNTIDINNDDTDVYNIKNNHQENISVAEIMQTLKDLGEDIENMDNSDFDSDDCTDPLDEYDRDDMENNDENMYNMSDLDNIDMYDESDDDSDDDSDNKQNCGASTNYDNNFDCHQIMNVLNNINIDILNILDIIQ